MGAGAGAAVGSCLDTPNWRNSFGATCDEYTKEHCSGGRFVSGHEWTAGSVFGTPEENCCACQPGAAKPRAVVPVVHHPPPPSPPSPPPPPACQVADRRHDLRTENPPIWCRDQVHAACLSLLARRPTHGGAPHVRFGHAARRGGRA